MHLDDERLQRLLDGELEPGAETAIRGHLATCEACRDQMTAVRREAAEVSRLLAFLDDPVPRLDPEDVVRASGRGGGRNVVSRAGPCSSVRLHRRLERLDQRQLLSVDDLEHG